MTNVTPFPSPARSAFVRKPPTPRQRQVVEMARDGYSDAEIAILLDISVKTVKCLLCRAYDRLGVDNRYAAGRALGMAA